MAKSSSHATIPVKAWLPILSLLKSFTADREIVPALKHLYFSGGTIRAFSGTQGAVWHTEWSMPGGEYALQADALVQLVSSINDQGLEEVEVGLTESGKSVTLRTQGFRASLPLLQGLEDAPEVFMFRDPPKKKVAVEPEFWAGLGQVMFSVSQDETKSQFRGVYWSKEGLFASSDGSCFSIAVPEKKYRVECPLSRGLLIPDALLSRLGGRLREVSHVGMEQESLFWVLFPGGAIYSTLFEARFPVDVCGRIMKEMREGPVKKGAGTWVTLAGDPAMLNVVLNRLLLFTDPPTYRMAAEVTKDTLHLAVLDSDGAQAAEATLPVKVEGPPTKFWVSAKYFQAALGVGVSFFHASDASKRSQLYWRSEDKRAEHLMLLLSEPRER